MHISNINAFLLHISYNAEFPTTYFKTNWDYKHQTIDDRQDINTVGWIGQQIAFVYLGLNQTWSGVSLNFLFAIENETVGMSIPNSFIFQICLDTFFYDGSMTILFLVIDFHIISELDFAANKFHDYSLLHTLHNCGLWSWLNYISKLIIHEVTFYYFTCCHQILSIRFEFSFIKTQ